jgi:hypothetical protein
MVSTICKRTGGKYVRGIVSVDVLSEGRDAKRVTYIQVLGRN